LKQEDALSTPLEAAAANEPGLAPVSARERIAAVDVLRGFALLGILLMNIESFGLVYGGWDPRLQLTNGANAAANLATWTVNQVLFDGKMRALFSMLFGAGAVLQIIRGEARGGGLRVADIFYRRTLWLILFGILHAYFVWQGDILYAYGVFGLFLLPLRKLRPRRLLVAGCTMLLIGSGKYFYEGIEDYRLRARAAAVAQVAAQGATLTKAQQGDQKKWEERQKEVRPDPEKIRERLARARGGYWQAFFHRMPQIVNFQSLITYRIMLYDALGMMLIGMALLLGGVLTGQRSRSFYLKLMLWGYGVGCASTGGAAWYIIRSGFNMIEGQLVFSATYDVGRLLVALGHVGLVMTVVKAGWLRGLTSRLAAVGQTALSGYLATSLICTTLFNGYGFGLIGKLQRYQLNGVVLAVWALLLVASPLWLRHWRYGPMEWLWRSLTYWERQPMRLPATTGAAMAIVSPAGLASLPSAE
jgi:uncharacterized protein